MSKSFNAASLSLAIAMAFSGSAFAQSPKPTREAVKAETAAGRASAPKGELSTPNQDKGDAMRTPGAKKDRAAVKAEAASANKPGSTKPMGQSSQKDQDKGVAKP